MIDLIHSNGPAPAYAIESDSEDDQWDEDPTEPNYKNPSIHPHVSQASQQDKKSLEWKPSRPQLEFDPDSTLLVLLGDPALLVASGLPQHLFSTSQSFYRLDQFLLLSDSSKFALSPAHIPLQLQTPLARKLLSDINPPSLTVISSYPAPTYIPTSSDQQPIRYLASTSNKDLSLTFKNLGCLPFDVPNLIKGFEAALMIQANIMKIEAKIILLPAISRPHDQKSSGSIPIGQYGFSTTGSTDYDLPPSLLSIDDPNIRISIKNILQDFFCIHHSHLIWNFPTKLNPSLFLFLKHYSLAFHPTFIHRIIYPSQSHHSIQRDTKDIGLMYL